MKIMEMGKFKAVLITLIFALSAILVPQNAILAQSVSSVSVITHFPDITAGSSNVRVRGFVRNQTGSEILTWFEWGDSQGFDFKTRVRRTSNSNTLRELTDTVRGIEGERSYYYRLVAEKILTGERFYGITIQFRNDGFSQEVFVTRNSLGQSFFGQSTFVNIPLVSTGVPIDVTESSATLVGVVTPQNLLSINVSFEWGLSSALGNRTPIRTINSVFSSEQFSYRFDNLLPDTRYHYRALVQYQGGTNIGITRSFSTVPEVRPVAVVKKTTPPKTESVVVEKVTKSEPVSKDLSIFSNDKEETPRVNGESTEELFVEEGSINATTSASTSKEDEQEVELFAYLGTFFGDTDNLQQVAGASSLTTFFPSTFIGWLALLLLIFGLISLIVYVRFLHEQLQEFKEKKDNIT